MCKHIKFNRNEWAPCAICLKEKRVATTLKNKDKYLQQIEEYKKEIAELEAKGRKATFAEDEIKMLQKLLDELN